MRFISSTVGQGKALPAKKRITLLLKYPLLLDSQNAFETELIGSPQNLKP